jgi:hypothetical protein
VKRFEAGSGTFSRNSAATTKPSTKRPRATATKKVLLLRWGLEDGEDGESEGGDVEPPRKKAKLVEPKSGRGDF